MLSGAAASPSRASDIPTPPPKAVHALAGASRIRHYGGAQGNPSEVRDCHQSKQSILLRLFLAADLRVCAPGRTRTCTLRIRSETRPVRLVIPRRIAAGRVRSPVRPVRFRAVLFQPPDYQGDCQPHGRTQVNFRPNDWTPPRPGLHPLGGAVPRARSTADNSSSAATGSIR
jgi:hypothetical protein